MGKKVRKVNPGRKRNRFAKEFKLEAVKLLDERIKGVRLYLIDGRMVKCPAARACPEFCVNGFKVNAVSFALRTG